METIVWKTESDCKCLIIRKDRQPMSATMTVFYASSNIILAGLILSDSMSLEISIILFTFAKMLELEIDFRFIAIKAKDSRVVHIDTNLFLWCKFGYQKTAQLCGGDCSMTTSGKNGRPTWESRRIWSFPIPKQDPWYIQNMDTILFPLAV